MVLLDNDCFWKSTWSITLGGKVASVWCTHSASLSCLNGIASALCPAGPAGTTVRIILTMRTIVLLLYITTLQTSDMKHVDILALYYLIIVIIFKKQQKVFLPQRALLAANSVLLGGAWTERRCSPHSHAGAGGRHRTAASGGNCRTLAPLPQPPGQSLGLCLRVAARGLGGLAPFSALCRYACQMPQEGLADSSLWAEPQPVTPSSAQTASRCL